MSQRDYAVPRGSRVLVTGANGYIASHIVDVLLQLGFHVRGTVRNEKPWLDRLFAEKYGEGRFESVIVPQMESEGAFQETIKDVAAVIHTASDLSLDPDPNVVIPKVIRGTINILEAAAKQPSVKRVVLTSSSAAVLVPEPNVKGIILEEKNSTAPPGREPFTVYAASKTEGEREAWNWIRKHKPDFEFNSVVPGFNSGPILHSAMSGSTMGLTRGLLQGVPFAMSLFLPQYYIDVRDCARLHVIALLDPDVKDERLFGFAGEFNWTDVIRLFRTLRPKNTKIPDPPANEGRDLSEVKPRRRAEDLLRSFFGQQGWTSFEESFAAGIEACE